MSNGVYVVTSKDIEELLSACLHAETVSGYKEAYLSTSTIRHILIGNSAESHREG